MENDEHLKEVRDIYKTMFLATIVTLLVYLGGLIFIGWVIVKILQHFEII